MIGNGDDASPEAMLQQIFALAQKYAKCSPNRLLIKCRTPEGGLIFSFNTGNAFTSKSPTVTKPKQQVKRPVKRNFVKAPRIFNSEDDDEAAVDISALHSSSDEFSMFEESDTSENDKEDGSDEDEDDLDFKSMRDRARALCLKQARQDLFMPDLKNIPWMRLIAPGWPEGMAMSLDHPLPSHDQMRDLLKRLEAGEVQFFWK